MSSFVPTKAWHDVDKSEWLPGPWQSEPDRMQWQDEATGLPCLIVRQERLGHLCGYVGVHQGHPFYEKSSYMDFDADVDVHGGLTYADHCRERICHEVEGEEDPVWWLGFDCAHAFDLSPELERRTAEAMKRAGLPSLGGTYRDFEYVRAECGRLAVQLAGIAVIEG